MDLFAYAVWGHLLATRLIQALFVVLKDERRVCNLWEHKTIGAHSTLKSRMRRLRAGVVILKLCVEYEASVEDDAIIWYSCF